mmetsp:Transcript_28186/g.38785  ORF Transcript_28186/g.38785 Transcript_28186/m.38785 type:complete len:88 (-) Transcript_28186:144-407(-)
MLPLHHRVAQSHMKQHSELPSSSNALNGRGDTNIDSAIFIGNYRDEDDDEEVRWEKWKRLVDITTLMDAANSKFPLLTASNLASRGF